VHGIVTKKIEGEKSLTFSWDTPLNGTTMKGVQSTPKFSSKEKFVVSNDNPSNERATIAFLEEPQNIEETLTCENSKEWECTMQEEYNSFMANITWTFVPLHVGRKPVSYKWVFKIK
jgi:hypothetical protein